MSEHRIQKQILDWLDAMHIFHWHNNTGAMKGSHKGKNWFVRFGTPGAPDIFAVERGRLIAIEVKQPGKKLSDKQEEFLEGLADAGAACVVAYCLLDVVDFIKIMRQSSEEPKSLIGLPQYEIHIVSLHSSIRLNQVQFDDLRNALKEHERNGFRDGWSRVGSVSITEVAWREKGDGQ